MTGSRGENSPSIGFFSLRTQFENVGDALINREMIRLMAGLGPTHVDLSRCPPEFRRTLALQDIANVRISANSKELFWKLLLEAWAGRRPFYFLSPGGYTGDVTGLLKRGTNLVALAVLRLLGVRLVQVGTSYDNLSTRHAWLLRMRSKLLWAHHVRDSESLAYGRGLGMNIHGIMPDLAFNIFDRDKGDRALTGKAAICFRSDQYPDQLAEVEQFVTRHLIQSFSSLVIVVQVDRDIVGATKLKSRLAQLGYRQVEIEVCAHDLTACAALYSSVDIVVGNRLHGLLLGARYCGRLLALVNALVNVKIVGLLHTAGEQDRIVDIGSETQTAVAAGEALRFALRTPFSGVRHRQSLVREFAEMISARGE